MGGPSTVLQARSGIVSRLRSWHNPDVWRCARISSLPPTQLPMTDRFAELTQLNDLAISVLKAITRLWRPRCQEQHVHSRRHQRQGPLTSHKGTVVFLKVRLRRRSQEHKRRIISVVSPHLCWKNDECPNNCAPKKRRHSIKNDEMSNNCSRLSPSAVHRLSHQLCAMAGCSGICSGPSLMRSSKSSILTN